MVREVLTINVGQCGIQLGATIWEQYCAEHGVKKDGANPSTTDDGTFQCFFEETTAGQYVPRNLMVDLEPNVIDDVKNSEFSAIYHPEFLLQGKEDAANNFARGHYTGDKDVIDLLLRAMHAHRQIDNECRRSEAVVVMGNASCWLFCQEPGIDQSEQSQQMPSAMMSDGDHFSPDALFGESSARMRVLHTMMVQSKPAVTDEGRMAMYHTLLDAQQMIAGNVAALNSNAHRLHMVDEDVMCLPVDRISEIAESYAALQRLLTRHVFGATC